PNLPSSESSRAASEQQTYRPRPSPAGGPPAARRSPWPDRSRCPPWPPTETAAAVPTDVFLRAAPVFDRCRVFVHPDELSGPKARHHVSPGRSEAEPWVGNESTAPALTGRPQHLTCGAAPLGLSLMAGPFPRAALWAGLGPGLPAFLRTPTHPAWGPLASFLRRATR